VLIYHALGTVAHAQYQLEDAENWYKQALTLSDRMGDEAQMAVEFHYLGLLEQGRQLFPEDAEHWFTLALEKYEKLGDWRGAGDECRQLGVLFHEQQKLADAESWYHRAREIFEEIQDDGRTARTYGQLGMVAEERGDLDGALSWAARTFQLAAANGLPVASQARAHLSRLRDKRGADAFAEWWRDFTGEEPPDELDAQDEVIL
jgi:tetratricopeptide (TPR) repeat protein